MRTASTSAAAAAAEGIKNKRRSVAIGNSGKETNKIANEIAIY